MATGDKKISALTLLTGANSATDDVFVIVNTSESETQGMTRAEVIIALAGIVDTANVTAAGALMDSELTDIAAVKALDQGVATTDSPDFAGLALDGEVLSPALALYTNRNLIINGDMRIAQRATSEVGLTTTGYHTIDRWELQINSAGTFTMAQVSSAISGFGSALRLTCTTADASLAAGDYVKLVTKLEGQDLQQLLKGTASAKDLSLFFPCQSDDTKTFIAEIVDNDNNRHIAGSFTISTGDAEQDNTFTVAGDTTGVLDNDENSSLELHIWLAAGSDFTSGTLATSWASITNANRAVGCSNLADAISNYFEITGVQLEVGAVATPFEYRSYGDELVRCQRYCEVVDGAVNKRAFLSGNYQSVTLFPTFTFRTSKRTTPSLEYSNVSHFTVEPWSGAQQVLTGLSSDVSTKEWMTVAATVAGDIGNGGNVIMNSASARLIFDSEL